MSVQSTLTYEGVLELFRETDRKFQETAAQIEKTAAQFQKTDQQLKALQKSVGNLRSNVSRVIEHMVRGRIEEKFQALGYHDIDKCYQNVEFAQGTPNAGEIDLVLENGDITILIEVKTRLQVPRVLKQIERLGKYRRYLDSKGRGSNMRFIGAVAGAVVENDAKDLAHENGMYVIVQSSKAVEIVTPPEGFTAKEW
jgi:transcriptional regulator of NAD metabolism